MLNLPLYFTILAFDAAVCWIIISLAFWKSIKSNSLDSQSTAKRGLTGCPVIGDTDCPAPGVVVRDRPGVPDGDGVPALGCGALNKEIISKIQENKGQEKVIKQLIKTYGSAAGAAGAGGRMLINFS